MEQMDTIAPRAKIYGHRTRDGRTADGGAKEGFHPPKSLLHQFMRSRVKKDVWILIFSVQKLWYQLFERKPQTALLSYSAHTSHNSVVSGPRKVVSRPLLVFNATKRRIFPFSRGNVATQDWALSCTCRNGLVHVAIIVSDLFFMLDLSGAITSLYNLWCLCIKHKSFSISCDLHNGADTSQ